jgi:hypothetical protein
MLAAIASLAACGGRAPAPAAPAAAAASGAGAAPAKAAEGAPAQVEAVKPSRLFPELVGPRGVVASEDGETRVLVDRMRLVVHADGAADRAPEMLPGGNVASIALPSRLGGGYLFHVNAGGGTEIWRAATWLGKLEPLARRGEVVLDIVPGFDRLYLRLSTGNRVIALDARTGAQMPLGPLPVSSSFGMLAFADGWRAVVDTDLRGPLATFDAGSTWRAVGVAEKPLAVGVVEGSLAVFVAGGRYLVDPRGVVTHRTDEARDDRRAKAPPGAPASGEPPSAEPQRPGPLGKHPLRAAVEDGWPDSATTAVVARGGALGRVSLRDGAVTALVEDAYPDRRSTCHAVRLGVGSGAGFVCGERDGPTAVYAFSPPLSMTPVLRFERPRFVAASGNGAIVIRGRCADDAPDGAAARPAEEADARWYCVRAVSGKMREVRVKGFNLGVERVVGLADGRVAVLVPPRGGSPGVVSIVSSGAPKVVPLVLPEEPKSAAHELRRGMWLEGFEERAPGVLGGWVEAGGPVVGVEVTLDGKVKAGEVRDDPAGDTGGVIVGGRFGVSVFEGGRAAETSDGGMTWTSFDLPARDEEARAVPSRGVGPVGAALPGWVRVGWGEPATPDDMKPAESPASPYVPLRISPSIPFHCELDSVATPPLADRPRAAPPPPPPSPPRGVMVRRSFPAPRPSQADRGPGWIAFRNTPPPPLAADEVGIDSGAPFDTVPLRAYAWGKRGGDWTRTGRWLVRFDDRFDASSGVRSSAMTASPWPDEAAARDGLGVGASFSGNAGWAALLDPSGRAALVTECHNNASCALYAVGDGQPVLPVRDASGKPGFIRPNGFGAVRVGDTWYFLSQSTSYDAVALFRVDLGVARQIGLYHRPVQRYGFEPPRLVRRALGGGVGLLVAGAPEPGDNDRSGGSWYVLPADLETGELGEAVVLARRDLAGAALQRCAPEQDGWVFDMTPTTATPLHVENAAVTLSDRIEMRVRMDPGAVCIERMATPGGPFFPLAGKAAAAGPAQPPKPLTAPPGRKGSFDDAPAIPLAVTEKASGRRWGLACARVGKK